MTNLIRSVCWTATLAVTLLFGGPVESRPKLADPPKKLTVMQRKLIHAQQVLAGLALNDFAKIDEGATGLLGCLSEASWRAIKSPKYETYSNEFLRNVENLKKTAKRKNSDGASLAYVEMTLTCIKCHHFLRDERMGAAPLLPLSGPKTRASR